MKIANGLNKLIYDRDEDPVDGVKLPFEQLAMLCREGEILGVELSKQMMGYGFDFYGTFVRTYALSQMVAYLKHSLSFPLPYTGQTVRRYPSRDPFPGQWCALSLRFQEAGYGNGNRPS